MSNSSNSSSEKSNFSNNMMRLVSGTAFSQLLTILALPFLTRLYGPESLGLLAVFVSATTIISEISSLRYHIAIPLPESEAEAVNLTVVSFGLTTLVSLLLFIVIWIFKPYFENITWVSQLAPYFFIIPIIIFFGGSNVGHPSLNLWFTRQKLFGTISLTRILNSSATVFVQITAGILGYVSERWLILGNFIGSVFSTLFMAVVVVRKYGRIFLNNFDVAEIPKILNRYRHFPLFDTWSTLINLLSWQLPVFLLSSYFPASVVGYYSLSYRMLGIPMSLVSGSMTQVFYQEAARAENKGDLTELVEGFFGKLVSFGLFPLLILTIVGREVFIVVFGEKWAEAGVYAQILGVWMFFWLISSPLSSLFYVLKKQSFFLRLNVVILITRFASLYIGGHWMDARSTIVLFSVSGILIYGYMDFVIMIESQVKWRRIFRILFQNLMSFLPAGVILMSLKMLNLHQWVVLTAALILVVLYGLSLLKKNPQLLKFVIGYMDKLWALFKWVPGLKILYETRNTQTPITFRTWFFQKILGFNHRAYWPVHFTSVVSGVKNIYAGVDTAPGYSPGCYIQGLGKVYIGDYTQIGPNVGIISANHDVYNSRHHQLGEEIRIGKYCWIGMGSVVLPGVVLGDFTIVGAGSVVTKSFPDGYCVIAGNPAKIISFLDKDKCKPFKNDFEYYGYIPKRKFETFREKYLKV